jgi:O-antigen/teichoic acid export membrane protein
MEPKSRYLRLVQTVLASGGALIINTLITLLLVPVISATLGNDAYGFVTLGKNIAQYATMITAALNSFAARYIVVSYHREDYSEANTYFSSTVYGDLILGTGLFAVALVGICFLEKLLVIPADLVTDVKLLFLLVFLNFWLVTVTTAFSASAHIKNRLHVVGMFKTLAYVCEAAILVVCFRFFSPHVFYVGLGLAAASFILALTNVAICKRYTPELKVEKQWFSWTAIRRLVVDGVWTSLNSLGDALNSGLDLLVCNLMLTPAAMGQLAISKTFYAMFSSMFLLVGQAFEPMYLKSYAEDDTKTLMGDFRVAMKLSGMISNIVFAGYVALGMVFYKLWIPGEDIAVIYTLTVINNMVTIPGGPMQPLYYIYTLTLKKKVPTFITIGGGLLNVVGMYLLIRYTGLGVYAVVWTTVIIMMIINFITNPLYMAHVLEQPWWTFYPAILRNLVSCGVLVVVFKALSRLYTPTSWLTLILSAVVLAVVGGVLHMLIVCSREDWKLLREKVRRKSLR